MAAPGITDLLGPQHIRMKPMVSGLQVGQLFTAVSLLSAAGFAANMAVMRRLNALYLAFPLAG